MNSVFVLKVFDFATLLAVQISGSISLLVFNVTRGHSFFVFVVIAATNNLDFICKHSNRNKIKVYLTLHCNYTIYIEAKFEIQKTLMNAGLYPNIDLLCVIDTV